MQEQLMFPLIATGDAAAFRTLYENYKGRIYGAALRWTRSSLAAEEITQEVFVRLWISRAKLEEVQDPEAYLFASVYYKISHYLRQEKNRLRILAQALGTVSGVCNETEESIAYADRRRVLHQALDRLTPQKKAIYLLKLDFGRSNREIGTEMNLSPHTVKSHLAQATKFLRHYLQHITLLTAFMLRFFHS